LQRAIFLKKRMKPLDPKYFTTIESKVVGRFLYETVRSKFPGATIILVPNGDPSRPIAAISFVPNEALENLSCDVLSAIMPRESVPERFKAPCDTKGFNRYFQAMFNQGNREMAFVTTNLVDGEDLDDDDYVKIDILKSIPPELNLIDYYDHGVNNVNELRPSDSFAVRSDQTNQYRTMVLKGVTNEQGASMSVNQIDDAIRRGETLKKEENYFFVHVVASETMPEIVSLLSDSTWIAADFFVRKIPLSDIAEMDSGPQVFNNFSNTRFQSQSMGRNQDRFDRGSRGGVSAFMQDRESSRNDRGGVSAFNAPNQVLVHDELSVVTKGIRRPNPQDSWRPNFQLQSAWATSTDIGESQAGRVSVGSRVIHQPGNQTNARYCHNFPGEKLVLCFSVWHGMRAVYPIDYEALQQESKLLIEDAQSTEKKALYKMLSKVFKSDDCCICFEPNPSIVLLRCTHQCLCASCSTQFSKTNCPICRQQISQSLDSSKWQSLLK